MFSMVVELLKVYWHST